MAGVCFVGYLAAGLTKNAIVTILISLAALGAALGAAAFIQRQHSDAAGPRRSSSAG